MRWKRAVIGVSIVTVAGAALSMGAARDRSAREVGQEVARYLPQAGPDVRALAANETFNTLGIANPAGAVVAGMASDGVGDGVFALGNAKGLSAGGTRVAMAVSTTDAGLIVLTDRTGRDRFYFAGDTGLTAASADMAEEFSAVSAEIAAGTVVVIDPQQKGALRPSSQAYDRRVAGVVAGANDYKPAITLGALSGQPNRLPVTLTGTAYCLATNANGEIKAGDLLTTSGVPGHAMKVTDYEAARGAILGKALEDLKGAKGHVLILASLQ